MPTLYKTLTPTQRKCCVQFCLTLELQFEGISESLKTIYKNGL